MNCKVALRVDFTDRIHTSDEIARAERAKTPEAVNLQVHRFWCFLVRGRGIEPLTS